MNHESWTAWSKVLHVLRWSVGTSFCSKAINDVSIRTVRGGSFGWKKIWHDDMLGRTFSKDTETTCWYIVKHAYLPRPCLEHKTSATALVLGGGCPSKGFQGKDSSGNPPLAPYLHLERDVMGCWRVGGSNMIQWFVSMSRDLMHFPDFSRGRQHHWWKNVTLRRGRETK